MWCFCLKDERAHQTEWRAILIVWGYSIKSGSIKSLQNGWERISHPRYLECQMFGSNQRGDEAGLMGRIVKYLWPGKELWILYPLGRLGRLRFFFFKGRGRGRENPKQAPTPSVKPDGVRIYDPEIMTWVKNKSLTLNQLSHQCPSDLSLLLFFWILESSSLSSFITISFDLVLSILLIF